MPERALWPELNLQDFARKLLDTGIAAEFDHSRLDTRNPLSLLTTVDCQQMDIFYDEEDWDAELSTFDVHEILGLKIMFNEQFDLPIELTLALQDIVEEMLLNPGKMIFDVLVCTQTFSRRNEMLFLSIMKCLAFSMGSQERNASIEEALLLYSMQGSGPLDRTDWRASVLAGLLGQETITKSSPLEKARNWFKLYLEIVLNSF